MYPGRILLRLSVVILFLSVFVIPSESIFADDQDPSHVASYWDTLKDDVIQCKLCPRQCILAPGHRGMCTVRTNRGGVLYTLGYGNPVAVHVDPIEKKPFFHFLPGSKSFSIATAGCNMRCLFCQNWQISQARPDETTNYDMPPQAVVDGAVKSQAASIAYTYTEPTVFYEYMLDTCKIAKSGGIKNVMHSCGYINSQPLEELLDYMDAVNIDLKGFNEEFYRKMGALADLEPVLETLKAIKERGVWLEITNLVIPGQNDSPEEIGAMCEWIRDNLGPDVPLHFSRFMPSFRLQNLPPTPIETLEEAYRIARDAGLRYVYIGNVPGNTYENTYCPECGRMVISRVGYTVNTDHLKNGKCGYCGYPIAGVWKE